MHAKLAVVLRLGAESVELARSVVRREQVAVGHCVVHLRVGHLHHAQIGVEPVRVRIVEGGVPVEVRVVHPLGHALRRGVEVVDVPHVVRLLVIARLRARIDVLVLELRLGRPSLDGQVEQRFHVGAHVRVAVLCEVVVHLLRKVVRGILQTVEGVAEGIFAGIDIGLHAVQVPRTVGCVHAFVGRERIDVSVVAHGVRLRAVVQHIDAKRHVPPLVHLQVAVVAEGE